MALWISQLSKRNHLLFCRQISIICKLPQVSHVSTRRCVLDIDNRSKMSFKGRSFVAGFSSGDEGESDEGEFPMIHVEGFRQNESNVDKVVESCTRGIAKIKRWENSRTASPELVINSNGKAELPSSAKRIKNNSLNEYVNNQQAATQISSSADIQQSLSAKPLPQRMGLYGITQMALGKAVAPLAVSQQLREMTTSPSKPPSLLSQSMDEKPSGGNGGVSPNESASSAIKILESNIRCSKCFMLNRPQDVVFSHTDVDCAEVVVESRAETKGCLTCFQLQKTHVEVYSHTDSTCPGNITEVSITKIDQTSAAAIVTPSVAPAAYEIFNLKIDTRRAPPLPDIILSKIVPLLRRGDFNCRLTDEMKSACLNILGNQYSHINDEALRTMRHSVLADRAMQIHARLSQKDIAWSYEQGQSIEQVASYFKAPAFTCLRFVLKERGHDPKWIKDAIAGRIPMQNARDIREREAAMLIDTTAAELEDRLGQATDFENRIGAVLDSLGVRYKTQDDMKGSRLTPDFLLEDSVQLMIGPHPIRWIDAKNFFGGVTRNHVTRLRQQATKYAEAFGPGALVFSMGFAHEMVSKVGKDVALLDFRWFIHELVNNSTVIAAQRASVPSALPMTTTTTTSTTTSESKKRSRDSENSIIKRGRFTSVNQVWNAIFESFASSGFTTTEVSADTVRDVNEMLLAVDADAEPYKKEEIELIRLDVLSDVRQSIENSKKATAPEMKRDHLRSFEEGQTALDIAARDGLPPLLVMRNILEARGLPPKDVTMATQPTATIASLTKIKSLKPREFESLSELLERNLFFLGPEKSGFEHEVTEYLSSVGVEVEPFEKPWRYFKVKSELTIEGVQVNWIITANRFGGASKRFLARMSTIVPKLIEEHGSGAVIFSLGFSDPNLLQNNKVVLVDFRLLGLASDE